MNKGLLSVEEALEVLLAGARSVAEVEEVPTMQAAGRVLARAQTSTMDVPPMDNSAMDGYALRLADVKAPDARLKVAQRIMAGAVGQPLAAGTAARIFTGAPIPPGADAIVMQEIFKFVQDGITEEGKAFGHFEATGVRPTFMQRLEASGIRLPANLFAARRLGGK